MDEDLVRDGRLVRLETIGRRSGRPLVVVVGFAERPDGSLVVAARDPAAGWAANLRADATCQVTLGEVTWHAHAEELLGRDHAAAIRDLILRYGTPSERLGAGPAFVVRPTEASDPDVSRSSR